VSGRCRSLAAILLAAVLAGGCGGGSPRRAADTGPALVLMATAPNSLDPAVGDNPEALEADWLVYTPLLTYLHSAGVPGSRPIPGLAAATPTVSGGGTVYTLTLLPGLRYSDGQPVKAGDFARAVERAVKLWPPASDLLTGHIVGAAAYAAGRARSISGVTADDATGEIQVHLTAPYGEFENLLALPALAPVPAATPLRAEPASPPPGVGLYKLAGIVPGRSFSLVVNPGWSKLPIAFLPRQAHTDIEFRITGDAQANASAVLDNRADLIDWTTAIPGDLLARLRRVPARRYRRRAVDGTYLAFLNVAARPFSSQLARQAVRAALDQNTLARLGSGALRKGCYVLPPALFGHPQDACPEGNPAGDGNLPLAEALVRRSGTAGARVTVWSPGEEPEEAWMAYYAALLDRIGFNAALKVVPAGDYYRTIGERRPAPQTGFAEDQQQIPYPSAFYEPLTAGSQRNWGEIDDPYLNRAVHLLANVPAASIGAAVDFWHQIELYTARRAYVAVLGYATMPELVSDRVDLGELVFNPAVGYDWSSLRFR
jgi:peptide/nickel transport system substrate-binding protein